ncbi:hypothetical protein MBLNU457_4381t1 [Dothideomycetes sp. NU457]
MHAEDSSSSLDPISILTDSSPLKQPRRISKGLTVSQSGRLSSPSKSMVFNAMGDNRSSPVRVRITVQEEPHVSPSRSSSRNTKTMTVPLKTAEQASPVRRRTRTTSNMSSASKTNLHSPRKSTPPRRRMTPARNTRPAHSENGDESTHSPLIDLHTGQISADYGVEQRSISSSHSKQNDVRDDEGDYSLSVMEPMEDSPEISDLHHQQVNDESMWRAMIQPDATQPREAQHTNDDNDDYSLSEDAEDDDDANDDDHRPVGVPGEMTVMESEEFSMISVDSLSSHQTVHSPATSVSRTKQSKPTAASFQRSKLNSSYLPSSPPTMPNNQETPVINEPVPDEPPAHVNPHISFPPVMTSMRESVVRSGRVLQDIVRSPDPNRPVSHSDDSGRSVFGGFSSGTRRQLRASLQVGAGLAENNSPLEGRTKYLSPSHLAKETRSHHRLPTPEDHEDTSAGNSSSTDITAGIVYPELIEGRHEASSSTKPAYDAMSWVPTGRAALISPMSANQESDGRRDAHKDLGISLNAVEGNDFQVRPVFSEQDGKDMEDASDEEEENRDIWQEEASRSFEEEDEPAELVEAPIKPRRSKLPGTWRRISGNNFHYSDSPEPEELQMRKTSNRSSAEDSAIATPPTSDSHNDDDDLEESIDEDEIEEAISPSSEGDALTPHSEASVQDGDDTGLFWQANLPSVFQRQGRPPLQNRRADMSMVSELKPLSSPVHRTSLDELQSQTTGSTLNMVPFIGRAGKNEHSSSALVTPLRKSLLKSSKIRSSPLAQDVSCMSVMTDEAEQSRNYSESEHHGSQLSRRQDSSMASDTRQLLGEMATARRRASQAMEDIMHSRQSISQTLASDGLDPTDVDLTKSYIENLNHDSPTKVVVNFNDSSIMGSSSLLAPRRHYPALFDDVPALNGQNPPAEDVSKAVVSPPSPVKLVSRLTNSFWDVISGTDGSKDIPPPAKGSQQQIASPSKVERESTTVPGTNVSDDVLRLRRKYGLLLDAQPFTMAHIRTLHRMLISTRHHSTSSIVPLAQPLPTSLQPFLNTTRRVGEADIVLDKKVLATIAAFMALLAPQTEIKRLEALGSWGDDGAKKARGFDSKGRHGSYLAFGVEGSEENKRAARKAGSMKGSIEGPWLVDVVVEILGKERATAR